MMQVPGGCGHSPDMECRRGRMYRHGKREIYDNEPKKEKMGKGDYTEAGIRGLRGAGKGRFCGEE